METSNAKKRTLIAAVFGALLSTVCSALRADHTDHAPCPKDRPAGSPSAVVVLEILKIKPNDDMEWDPWPLPDDHADIYGWVTIEGEPFDLPRIQDSDYPHWDGSSGRFAKGISSRYVDIEIGIREHDAISDSEIVDINPDPAETDLRLVFDTCSLKVSGVPVSQEDTQAVVEVTGGSGDHAATIWFKLGFEDDRPPTSDDLALVGADLVQVVPASTRLVANKPTVLFAQVANNFSVDMTTQLHVAIGGSGFAVSGDFPIDIKAGEVKKFYFYSVAPLRFPGDSSAYPISWSAELGDAGLPPDACPENNGVEREEGWEVCTTPPNYTLFWSRVGLEDDDLEDIALDEMRELGTAFIKATYPLSDVVSLPHADMKILPPSVPDWLLPDWLEVIEEALDKAGIETGVLLPYLFVFELNDRAVVSGIDRLMGVLPPDWFDRFALWEDVVGLSLMEYMPHAVIFESKSTPGDGDPGPRMTLPAHELGHTYGLSVDSTLKGLICRVLEGLAGLFGEPELGELGCAVIGGYDEENHDDPADAQGNPSRGYWVLRGDEPTLLAPLADQEQCDSHCFMGPSPINAHLLWDERKRWIDTADYDQLLEKLKVADPPDTVPLGPDVIYVSGMISYDDRAFLGSWYHLPEGTADRVAGTGLESSLYAFRFLDERGKTIQEIGLPLNWNTPDRVTKLPVTFFGLLLPFPRETRSVEVWNRMGATRLASRQVSLHVPAVNVLSPAASQATENGSPLDVTWGGTDADGDTLTYTILLSRDGKQWWPAAHRLEAEEHTLATDTLKTGTHFLKVLASDGVHVGESPPVPFVILPSEGVGPFRRGDCNDDGTVDITDVISTLGVLFLGQGEITCEDACDSNDDGEVDISDPIATLGILFLGQGAIPLPGVQDCGVDPTDDSLSCEQPPEECR